jgi:DNA-binding winged helix-turn-helix (wHTH) protein
VVALLERPGEVVTRVELRRRVWKNGAYVDFDRSLNKAIVSLGG